MIFAGTGHAFFYSRDDGKTWTQFKGGLPAAPVNWIEVPKNAPEVAIATYGRGLWILRDVWQLEQEDTLDQQAMLQLYKPRPATFSATGAGAQFIFNLKAAPPSPVIMEILDANGTVVSKNEITVRPGLNRATWNLRYPSPEQPVLRSIPPDNPHIWEAGRWEGRQRPVTHWGLGAQRWQPTAAPGKYTVRLTLDGKAHAQPFEVWRDVTLPSSDADLVASSQMQRDVAAAMNQVVDRINRIEVMRMQVEDLRQQHGKDPQLDAALAGIYKRMYETELHYLSRTEMHSDDKWYVEKYKLYLNLVWLMAEIGGAGGDVMGGVGYRPTSGSVAVFKDLRAQLDVAEQDFKKLLAEVDAFNKKYAGRLAPITGAVK